jgi:GNAT superfamily N-acetyltransferase
VQVTLHLLLHQGPYTMPLESRFLQDEDLEEVIRMQHEAFRNPDGIDNFLSPEITLSDESVATSIERRRDMMLNNKAATFMVVVDSDLKKIIACAIWEIFPHERTEEQVNALARQPPPAPGAHLAAWDDYFGNLATQRRKLGTRPIAILRSIATHPEQQRRGAAGLLMEQFVKEVDYNGLEGYVEASGTGRALYARYGFAPVFERVFELEKYGGSGRDFNTVMIRPAKSKLVSE